MSTSSLKGENSIISYAHDTAVVGCEPSFGITFTGYGMYLDVSKCMVMGRPWQ
jgi:hypothetical protein